MERPESLCKDRRCRTMYRRNPYSHLASPPSLGMGCEIVQRVCRVGTEIRGQLGKGVAPVTSLLYCAHFLVSEAVDDVVVHHSDSLHERVTDGWSDETKTSLQQVTAHLFRFRGSCRYALH